MSALSLHNMVTVDLDLQVLSDGQLSLSNVDGS